MTEVVRGSTVRFSTKFYDPNNVITTPVSANLYVTSFKSGVLSTDTVVMTDIGSNTWQADWESINSEPGLISWHIRSGGSPKSASEGEFDLLANPANPSP